MQVFHEQEDQLKNVFCKVGTLRRQANDMGGELEEQRVLLGEVFFLFVFGLWGRSM